MADLIHNVNDAAMLSKVCGFYTEGTVHDANDINKQRTSGRIADKCQLAIEFIKNEKYQANMLHMKPCPLHNMTRHGREGALFPSLKGELRLILNIFKYSICQK